MRSILVIYLLIITVFISCGTQKIYHLGTGTEYQIKGKKYQIKDHFNHHDKILGNWVWIENNDSLLMTFKEFEKYSYPESSKQYRDAIFGKYRYIRNGEKVIDKEKIIFSEMDSTKIDFTLPTSIELIKIQN